jgi:DNA-binding NtrC family response regulator
MPFQQLGFQQKVLVVDQPAHLENLLRLGLLNFPVQMTFISNRRSSVVTALENEQPDLLISALQYEDGTAADLLHDIESKKLGLLPAIFITEPAHLEVQKQVLRLGAFDLVQQPLQIEDLHRKMSHVMQVTGTFHHTKSRLESFVEYQKLFLESKKLGISISEYLERQKNGLS